MILSQQQQQFGAWDTSTTAASEALSTSGAAPAEPDTLTTQPNTFGVYRRYPCIPSREPSNPNPYAGFSPATWTSRAPIGSDLSLSTPEGPPEPEGSGFSKATWSAWLNSGSPYKSCGESNKITPYFTHPAWNPQEFAGYNAYTESRRFDREHFSEKAALKFGDGWKEVDIEIPIPCVGHKQKEVDAPVFKVRGLLYRDLIQVITKRLRDPTSFKEMYLQPFSEHWAPTEGDTPIRVYGEVYSSDAMLDAQHRLSEKLRNLPLPQPEAFLVGLMLASDSTFLTQFSQASMWPIYMFFGNVSKYTRSSPDSPANHVAYLPKVRRGLIPLFITDQLFLKIDEEFSEFYMKTYHQLPSNDILAFVKRELVHRVLRLMFGGQFSEAHKNGIITECADHIARLWFPWLVCHSTDYPERFVLFHIIDWDRVNENYPQNTRCHNPFSCGLSVPALSGAEVEHREPWLGRRHEVPCKC